MKPLRIFAAIGIITGLIWLGFSIHKRTLKQRASVNTGTNHPAGNYTVPVQTNRGQIQVIVPGVGVPTRSSECQAEMVLDGSGKPVGATVVCGKNK
jgi:hypothetical protein